MRKVLIAHNPGPFADIFADQLRDNYDVWLCHTGADALSLINHLHPDILILYLSLPDMDGITILQKVDYKPRVIIALTTLTTDVVVQQAAAVGVNDIILLPCSIGFLLDRISTHCSLTEETPSQKN